MTKSPAKTKSTRQRNTLPLELTHAMLQQSAAPQAETPSLFRTIADWFERRRQGAMGSKLRVAETISLGEKRFVSVVHVDGQRFLIGGSASNVALLTQLGAQDASFESVLRKSTASRKRTPARTRQVAS